MNADKTRPSSLFSIDVYPRPAMPWVFSATPELPDNYYWAGTVGGAPLSFTKNTRNFAGLVLLAFLDTV